MSSVSWILMIILMFFIIFSKYLTINTITKNVFIHIVQSVHLSTQKGLMAPMGINPWVQEGALSLIIKLFLSLRDEKIFTAQQHT